MTEVAPTTSTEVTRRRHPTEHLLSHFRLDWSAVRPEKLQAEDVRPIFGIAEQVAELDGRITPEAQLVVATLLEQYTQLLCEVMGVDAHTFTIRFAELRDTVGGHLDQDPVTGAFILELNKLHVIDALQKTQRGLYLDETTPPEGIANAQAMLDRLQSNNFFLLGSMIATIHHELYHMRQFYDPEYFEATGKANQDYQEALKSIEQSLPPVLHAMRKEKLFRELYASDLGERSARIMGLKALIEISRSLQKIPANELSVTQRCLQRGLAKAIEVEFNDVVHFFDKEPEREPLWNRIQQLIKGTT